jgi:MFS transporter, FHS family, glucose/mannose:H+ symporter
VHWPSVVAAFLCLFSSGLLDNARGPLFPDVLRGLTLTDTDGAWLFAAASAAGFGGSLAGPVLIARVRVSHGLRLGLLLAAAGVGAVSVARSAGALAAASALFGFAFGLLNVAQSTLIQRSVPPALQRQAFGGLHSMYAVASLLAPLVVGAAARAGADWRRTFLALAAVPVGLLVLSIFLREPPAKTTETRAASAPVDPTRAVVVCLLAALTVAAELALSTRLVLHLQRLEYDPDVARLYLSGFFLCLLIGRLTLSFVRTTRTHRELLALSAGAGLVLSMLGLLLHPGFLCLTALALSFSFPTLSALVADEFPGAFDRVTGHLLAVVCVVVMLTHWALGRLSDATSLWHALWLSPAFLALALALILAQPGANRARHAS